MNETTNPQQLLNGVLNMSRLILFLATITLVYPSFATTKESPKPITPMIILITDGRLGLPADKVPAAISVINEEKIQLGTQQLNLDESLSGIPGLFMQNRYNFAQDLRISIRGFGARANFGIRGIKILVDGIPETLPDGQGQVDSIDLGSAQQIEVIRGPSSSLWGNASGGVINITTEDGPAQPYLETRVGISEFGHRKFQLKSGGEHGRFNYLMNASRFELDGFRDHSRVEANQFNSKVRVSLGALSNIVTLVSLTNSPVAQDPGGLTQAQVEMNPTQANPRNMQFDASEQVNQQKVAFTYNRSLDDKSDLSARNYYVWREFSNKLPFVSGGAVKLERFFVGGGLLYSREGAFYKLRNRLVAGLDFDHQRDSRKRFDNNQGELGALAFDQNELVTGTGAFIRNELTITNKLDLFIGARYDWVTFDVKDQFISDGDDSGKRTLKQLSPMIGVSYELLPRKILYANVATSFETPTTAEFANPSGGGGLNPKLEPQLATNYELGIKATLPGGHSYELALFHIDVEDELTPFEAQDQPGRNFFVNAGSSQRKGVELAIFTKISKALSASLAYTYSDFVFTRFTNSEGDVFDNKRIPGVPKNLLQGALSYQDKGFFSTWEFFSIGSFFVNNANSAKTDSYFQSNLRGGYSWRIQQWQGTLYLGINNLWDKNYISNARINAFGGRYFEPGPGRNIYTGISFRRLFGKP